MSKDNATIAKVTETATNATETAEQKAERQQKETAVNRLDATTLSRIVTGDSKSLSFKIGLHRSIVKGLVAALHEENERKAKDISADVNFTTVTTEISREEFTQMMEETYDTIIAPASRLASATNQSPVYGGLKPRDFAIACIGAILPGTSANQAANFKNAVLSAMEAAKTPARSV